MKTKILLLTFLFAGIYVNAQTDYYANKTTVVGTTTSVVYTVEYMGDKVNAYNISNATNTKTDTPMRHLDGSLVDPEDKHFGTMEDSNVIYRVFREVFTTSEIANFASTQETLIIGYILDIEGNVVEVSFILNKNQKQPSISPDQLYMVEQKIKQYMKFRVNDAFKDVNFIIMGQFFNFRWLQYPPR